MIVNADKDSLFWVHQHLAVTFLLCALVVFLRTVPTSVAMVETAHPFAQRPRASTDPLPTRFSGNATVQSCQRVYGAGRDTCSMVQDTVHPVSLTLFRAGEYVVGDLSMFRVAATGPVSGSKTKTDLVLHAILSRAADKGVITVLDWHLTETNDGLVTAGVTLRRDFVNLYGRQIVMETYGVSELRP